MWFVVVLLFYYVILNLDSCILSADLKKMLELSYNIRHPSESSDIYNDGFFRVFEASGIHSLHSCSC